MLIDVVQTLRDDLRKLTFSPPVCHVYNPLEYAFELHSLYLERFAGKGQVVLLGMNPGPWGMAQTGVPFGEVAHVRDWMGLEGTIGRPENEHPKRPVAGLKCPRSEVSGRRLWGWAATRFGTAEAFFEKFFVLNYCPLLFLEASGRNRTPDKIVLSEREPLLALCDQALRDAIAALQPREVVGVGAWAKKCATRALGTEAGQILHPSPASPAANRGWAKQAEKQLVEQGLLS